MSDAKALSVEVIDAQNFKVAIPSAALRIKAEELKKSEAIKQVTNASEQNKAIAVVAVLKGITKAVETLREQVKAPFYQTGKAIDAKAAEYVKEIKDRIRKIESMCGEFQRKEQEKAEAARQEQLRQQREARERLEEIERQKQQAKSEEEKLAAEFDAAEAQDDLARASATSITPEVPKAAGAAVKREFTYEVTDIDAFFAWDVARRSNHPQLPSFVEIKIQHGLFKQYIGITGVVDIPGIKITETTRVIGRSVPPSIALS